MEKIIKFKRLKEKNAAESFWHSMAPTKHLFRDRKMTFASANHKQQLKSTKSIVNYQMYFVLMGMK